MSKWINVNVPAIVIGAAFLASAFLASAILLGVRHRQTSDEEAKRSIESIDIQYIQDERGICFAMVRDRSSKKLISVTPLDCRWIGLEQFMRKSHAIESI